MQMTGQQRMNTILAPEHLIWAGPSQKKKKREDRRLRFDAENCSREASNSFLYLQLLTRAMLCRMPHICELRWSLPARTKLATPPLFTHCPNCRFLP